MSRSVSSECGSGLRAGGFLQSHLDENLFYPFPGHPMVYYAQVPQPFDARQGRDKRNSPNCFVKAFRWYTQEHNVHKRTESVKLENPAGFAAWLDQKYEQFLQDKRAVRTPSSAGSTDQKEAFGNISSVRIHTKRTFNPWKRRRRAASNRDGGDGCEKCKQSLETILPPKDMSRRASECTFHVKAAKYCDSSRYTATSSDTQVISCSKQKSIGNDVDKKNMRATCCSKSVIGESEIEILETAVQIEFLNSPGLLSETQNQTKTKVTNPSKRPSPRHNNAECQCSEKNMPISETITKDNPIKEKNEKTETSTQYNESEQRNESETGTQNSEDKVKNGILSSRTFSSTTEIKPSGRKSIDCECPKDHVKINTGTEYIDPAPTRISTLPTCAVCHACPSGTADNPEQVNEKLECPKDQVKISTGTENIETVPTSKSTLPTCAVRHAYPSETAAGNSEQEVKKFECPKDQVKLTTGTKYIEPARTSISTFRTCAVCHACPAETADNDTEQEKEKLDSSKDQVKFTAGTKYIEPARTSTSTFRTCAVCHACPAETADNDTEQEKEKLDSSKDQVKFTTGTKYIEPARTSTSTFRTCAVCHACPAETADNDTEQEKEKLDSSKDQVKFTTGTKYIEPDRTSYSTFRTCAVCHACPAETADNDTEQEMEKLECLKDQVKLTTGTKYIKPARTSSSTFRACAVCHACPAETAGNDSNQRKEKYECPKLISQSPPGSHDKGNTFERIKCKCEFKKNEGAKMPKFPVDTPDEHAVGYYVEKNAQTSDHAIAVANVALCKCPVLVRVVVPNKEIENVFPLYSDLKSY